MDPREAEGRLRELARAVSTAAKDVHVGREVFGRPERQVREIAVAVLGPESPQVKDVNTQERAASQLARLRQLSQSVRTIRRDQNVVHLQPSPAPDEADFYRKQLSRLDEEIASMLLTLRDF